MSSKRQMDHLERTASNSRQSVSFNLFMTCATVLLSLEISRRGQSVMNIWVIPAPPQALYPAQVCGIANESETVKRLRIAVHPEFTFRAGQW